VSSARSSVREFALLIVAAFVSVFVSVSEQESAASWMPRSARRASAQQSEWSEVSQPAKR